ncbi:rRNA pseudouridine synthase [Candidatus Saccharibacteria bacterium]|nr:rRNA pseudouridine synthase [Candidatus Saccharibacteria bacterium]
MRINKFIAQATGLSRRAADDAIDTGRVQVNGKPPDAGQQVADTNIVTLDGQRITPSVKTITTMLNKPIGYVCSRDGQGSKTIYDLLPEDLHQLKPVGRLDKNSSGLLLMTTDGTMAHELTHPKFEKIKKYKIALNKDLSEDDFEKITATGVELEDGLSKFSLDYINAQNKEWKVEMKEGKNRQIRRTFEHLGYNVVKLHRTHFGSYVLASLPAGTYKILE